MPAHMRAIAAGVTDVGRERDHNEDRFILLPEFEVFVVADGMGGHQCGEVASRMATSTIANYFRADRGDNEVALSDVLRLALMEANSRIHRRASTSAVHRGMGTTVVAAAFSRRKGRLYVAHAGDSRCYRVRKGELEQITRDHSLVEEALRSRPDITAAELAYLPGNVITRALGVEAGVDIDLSAQDVELGDIFLLCSDGLHGFVEDVRIGEILREHAVLTNACGALVAEANKNGGGDNITAVIVRIEEYDEPWARSTSVPPPPAKEVGMPASEALSTAPLPRVEDSSRTTVAAAGVAEEDLAHLEADDTAQVMVVTDADAVLAGRASSGDDSED
jgi:protein phosphatase